MDRFIREYNVSFCIYLLLRNIQIYVLNQAIFQREFCYQNKTKYCFFRPVVTLLADRLQVDLVELRLDRHLLVAGRAGKVVDTPAGVGNVG